MLQIIQSITCGATLLIAFLVLANPQHVNRKANQWLSVFLFCLFIVSLNDLLITTSEYRKFPHLIGISNIVVLLIPPSFYFSIDCFVSSSNRWRKIDALHFLPFILMALFNIPFLLASGDFKYKELQGPSVNDNILSYIFIAIFYIQITMYWILSYIKLTQHQKNIKLVISTVDVVNLQWLKYFLYGFLFILVLWYVEIFFEAYISEALLYTGFMLSIFLLAFYAMKQGEVYSFDLHEIKEVDDVINASKTFTAEKKRLISEQNCTELKKQLIHVMESEKLFLDNELSLPKLAKTLHVSSHIVSYVLNEGFGENFYQFINRYRVEEAKILLVSPEKDHLNLLGIASEAGFSSKTVFNTTFKKVTGLSPSEFKNISLSAKGPDRNSNL